MGQLLQFTIYTINCNYFDILIGSNTSLLGVAPHIEPLCFIQVKTSPLESNSIALVRQSPKLGLTVVPLDEQYLALVIFMNEVPTSLCPLPSSALGRVCLGPCLPSRHCTLQHPSNLKLLPLFSISLFRSSPPQLFSIALSL